MVIRNLNLVVLALAGTLSSVVYPARAESLEQWPLVLEYRGVTNTIYQPQLDSWDYLTLTAHAAIAVQPPGAPQPTFGVIEVSARTFVDRAERMVTFENLQVAKASFPSAPEQADGWAAALQVVLPPQVQSMSLDRIEASLAVVEARQQAQGLALRNDPPVIMFANEPALLIPVDGPPVYRPVEKLEVERVGNTRALLLRDKAGKHYLHLFDGYVEAPGLGGPWSVARKIPRDISKAEKQAVEAKQVDLLAGQEDAETGKPPSLKTTPVPILYLTTTPTELVQTDGAPMWSMIPGTQLLYVTNTASPVFKYMVDQKTYVLASGRWFRALSNEGPWEFVPGESLPGDFARIPDDSPKENVKASVPGTRQAQEAAIANGIPQSTQVDRSQAQMSPPPQYDGPAQLKPIEGTPLFYVFNCATPVIRVGDYAWYACQNGVWFVATAATGPWVPATSVPAIIYSIPVTSPIHYVTYARVYAYDARYIYVGLTPGYYGTVVTASGTVVYGTGYVYPAYVGTTVYISYPITYGYACNPCWTPWAGWGFGFAVGWAMGSSWRCCPPAPYWGAYYHGCYGVHYNARGGYAAWGPYGWAGSSGYIYHHNGSWSGVSRSSGGYNAWTGNAWAAKYGHAYNSSTGTSVAGRKGGVQNVYTGNYAYGKQGVAYNNRTGTVAAGGKVTVGNAYTGKSVTAGRATVYNPRTGQGGTVSGVRTDNGGVVKVGDHTIAAKDGNVYRQSGSGGWNQAGRPEPRAGSSSSGFAAPQRNSAFDNVARSQDLGAQRAQSFQGNRPSFGGGSSRSRR